MKILKCSLVIALAVFFTNSAKAQFNPNTNHVKMVSAGLGLSSWGVPFFARFEVPVADSFEDPFFDNITVGGGVSFQAYGEHYFGYRWRHTIIGIHARSNYHFNELLEIDDQWDVYAGLNLGYYIWNTKYDDNSGFRVHYEGSGSGGLSLGLQIGGQYFINDNLGINLELGGGTVLSGGTVGVTFLL
jgi:hypothetical protein